MNQQREGITCTTPDQIAFFRLASLKQQLKMEKVGLKSSGGAIRPRIAAEFGLKPRDSHDKFIAAVQAKMDSMVPQTKE